MPSTLSSLAGMTVPSYWALVSPARALTSRRYGWWRSSRREQGLGVALDREGAVAQRARSPKMHRRRSARRRRRRRDVDADVGPCTRIAVVENAILDLETAAAAAVRADPRRRFPSSPVRRRLFRAAAAGAPCWLHAVRGARTISERRSRRTLTRCALAIVGSVLHGALPTVR